MPLSTSRAALCLTLATLAIQSVAHAQRSSSADALTLEGPAGTLHPGGVGLITVGAPSMLANLEGEAFGRGVRFWPTSDRKIWRGLVGVALGTAPGRYDLRVWGTTASGRQSSAGVALHVVPKRFETRRLSVAPALANPPPSEAARIARESQAMADAFAGLSSDRLWSGSFDAPVPGSATSSFGRLSIMNGEPTGRHQGADFRAETGTPVRAPNRGRVVLADELYFAGNTVILDHGLGIFSLLAHLSRIDVQPGQLLKRGDVLGSSGATGRVTGPHLHWAVRFGDISVDPLALMAAVVELGGEPVDVADGR